MPDEISISQNDSILEIRFRRPEKKNALTAAMYGVMADALERQAAAEAIRTILFSAEGGTFCAGNDLSDFARAASTSADEALGNVLRFLHALASAEKPVIAAVSGDGIGIGTTLLLHCDIVVIAENAKLTTPFTSLGLTPEAGSSLLLPGAVGAKRAFMMLALGEAITGVQAVEAGLATIAVTAGEVDTQARQLALRCAQFPPEAVRLTKRLMRDGDSVRSRIDIEAKIFRERLGSPEARAAFEAFFRR